MEAAATASAPVVGSPAFPPQFPIPSSTFPLTFTTPSPLQTAVTPSWSSSKTYFHSCSNLMLRALTFLLAFASAAAIAAAPKKPYSLLGHSAFKYNFAVATIVSFYSAIQLLKDVRDFASVGFLLSAEKSDMISFILDQILAYLLLSSSSVSIHGIHTMTKGESRHVAIASACFSFVAFSAIAISAIMSGYRLCKRIIW